MTVFKALDNDNKTRFKETRNIDPIFHFQGKINKQLESFSLRQKDFWDVGEAKTLLGPKFTKASLGHEPDGLVFQPEKMVSHNNVMQWEKM